MSTVAYVSDMREWTLSDLARGESMVPLKVTVNWSEIPSEAQPKVIALSTFVLTTIVGLIERENELSMGVQANHRRVWFTVRVAESDVGLAVGSGGRHADALRTLLIAACRKLKFHFDLDIGGPTGDPDWSSD